MISINKINKALQSKFTLLFFSLVLLILISPYVDSSFAMRFILLFAILFIFVAVIFAIKQKPIHRWIFFTLALSCFILSFFYAIHQSNLLAILSSVSFIWFFSAIIYHFSKDIMSQKIVTHDIILGSICIYLLIGISYAYIYSLIEIFHPGSFIITTTHKTPGSFDLLYFSYTTLTTVGYGDIVSTSVYSKSIVIFESITGIFYMATLVARLVGAFARVDPSRK